MTARTAAVRMAFGPSPSATGRTDVITAAPSTVVVAVGLVVAADITVVDLAVARPFDRTGCEPTEHGKRTA